MWGLSLHYPENTQRDKEPETVSLDLCAEENTLWARNIHISGELTIMSKLLQFGGQFFKFSYKVSSEASIATSGHQVAPNLKTAWFKDHPSPSGPLWWARFRNVFLICVPI
jgi:hypothetical protein